MTTVTAKAKKPPSDGGARGARVLVGAISGAHGMRGLVRLKSFTAEPADIGSYAPLEDEAGTPVRLGLTGGQAGGALLARIEGTEDRTAAEAMKGTRLYVPRSALPEPDEDEWYHADLVGLSVCDEEDRPLGTVRAVLDHGAGDVIEIETGEAT